MRIKRHAYLRCRRRRRHWQLPCTVAGIGRALGSGPNPYTPGKAEAIRRAGVEVAVADALNRAAIVKAVAIAKPDVMVHEMTSLSAANDLRKFDKSFAVTNRLRTQGLDNLLAAAKQANTPRVVAQSFCGWPYARSGSGQIGGRSARP
jgi:nucleoside-diphosphate-sugar epimerase